MQGESCLPVQWDKRPNDKTPVLHKGCESLTSNIQQHEKTNACWFFNLTGKTAPFRCTLSPQKAPDNRFGPEFFLDRPVSQLLFLDFI
jgi:hypothetical protein